MQTDQNITLGVTLNIIASVFFALMFAQTSQLTALDGEEIFGWRMCLTFPCLTAFIALKGYWPQVISIYQRLYRERHFALTRLISALLLSVQLWLFVWAPGNGHGLAVSLGYFILPITMVIIGRMAFRDQMSRFQKLACAFAVLGIANQMVLSQSMAWPTLAVCLGYPGYFWLRRRTDTNNIGGLWFDMALALPFSLFFIIQGGEVVPGLSINMNLLWPVLGLGLISALALTFQALSAPHLNLSLFGLLIYVEPVLLMLVALALGETIRPAEWPTYIAIWLSVIVLMAEGIRGLKKWKAARVVIAPKQGAMQTPASQDEPAGRD
ncbi:permease [Kushneria pakistanensis]|uniref:Permease n=1 Tax=Kushneria pakistanensis TaxID=1508770 RepID=A0ABQ3FQ48_9GAMM|nr:EamA family transporter RarD [Kushneria pakistanensis]GHC33054.1 permease [Kushneria pakistanensis]